MRLKLVPVSYPDRVKAGEEYAVSFVCVNQSLLPVAPCWCKLYRDGRFEKRMLQIFFLSRTVAFTFKLKADGKGREVVRATAGFTPLALATSTEIEVEVV